MRVTRVRGRPSAARGASLLGRHEATQLVDPVEHERHVVRRPVVARRRRAQQEATVGGDGVARECHARLDAVFSDVDVVEPDLVFVSKARQADLLTAAHISGAPDLVVEIGSPSTRKRDETIKRWLYERFGVAEFWVVDPELDDEIKVYRLVDGRFERTALLSLEQGDVLTSPLLPGLTLRLAEIFRE